MNIALLAGGMSWGKKESLAITVRQYAQELQRRGHRVAIISEKKGGLAEEVEDGVSLFRADGGVIFAYVRAFREAQKIGRFDVIHGFSAAPFFIVRSWLCKLLEPRARIVHTLKSYSRSKFGCYFTWLLNFAHAVTVPTEVYRRKLRFVRNVSVVRSHIDTTVFHQYSAAERAKVRKALKLPKPVLFYYGATWNEKGVDVLFHALRLLLDKGVFLLVVTRYELEPSLRELIQTLQLGDHIRVVNEKINVPDYLNAVDVCVLPYKNLKGTEGNPSCLLEAAACNTPVVTTRLPELEEIFDGIMVRPNDPHALAEGILLALRSTHPIDVAQFDVKKVTDDFLRLY